jgi:hypothetical protein
MNNKLKNALQETFISEPSADFNVQLMLRVERKTKEQTQPKENHNIFYLFLFLILGLPFLIVLGIALRQTDFTRVDFSFFSGLLSRIWSDWQVVLVFLFAFFGIQFLGRFSNFLQHKKKSIGLN